MGDSSRLPFEEGGSSTMDKGATAAESDFRSGSLQLSANEQAEARQRTQGFSGS